MGWLSIIPHHNCRWKLAASSPWLANPPKLTNNRKLNCCTLQLWNPMSLLATKVLFVTSFCSLQLEPFNSDIYDNLRCLLKYFAHRGQGGGDCQVGQGWSYLSPAYHSQVNSVGGMLTNLQQQPWKKRVPGRVYTLWKWNKWPLKFVQF